MARTGNPEASANVTSITGGVDLQQVANAGEKSMFAFAHLHSHLLRSALEVNAELLDFARKRLDQDIDTSEKFSRCRTMSEAMEVMNRFCQTAMHDYAEESSRIVKIGSDATRRSMEEIAKEADEASRG